MDDIISSFVEHWLGDDAALFILSAVMAAVFLFAIRRQWRSFYGIIEIAAGLVLLYTSHSNVAAVFSNDFGSGFQTVRTTVVLTVALGGVFVIVRGLDNIWEAWKSQPSRQADGAP
jgi:hypothetical protein